MTASGTRMAREESRPSAMRGWMIVVNSGWARNASRRLPSSSASSVVRWTYQPSGEASCTANSATANDRTRRSARRGDRLGVSVFQHLLHESVGCVATRDAMRHCAAAMKTEARRSSAARTGGGPEVNREREMRQTAIAAGWRISPPMRGLPLLDRRERPRLLSNATRQPRVSLDIFRAQRRAKRPASERKLPHRILLGPLPGSRGTTTRRPCRAATPRKIPRTSPASRSRLDVDPEPVPATAIIRQFTAR